MLLPPNFFLIEQLSPLDNARNRPLQGRTEVWERNNNTSPTAKSVDDNTKSERVNDKLS
jgi:hypothetical protein